jgi:hypothetical protein
MLLAARTMPPIAARQGTTVTVPWVGAVPEGSFGVAVRVDPPPGLTDAEPSTNATVRRVDPPSLEVHAPLAGTRWGGTKHIRFGASSVTRPNITCSVAIAPEGGDFTGVPGVSCDLREIDTTNYEDGEYVIRVTADDGLQTIQRDVPIRIANQSPAVRAYGDAPGALSVTLAAGIATTKVAIPVGARVLSATGSVVPLPAERTVITPTPVYDYAGAALVRYRGTLHVFYAHSSGGLWTRASYDDGATWTPEAQLGTSPTESVPAKAVAVNGSGIHLVFSDSSGVRYRRSDDGVVWTAAAPIAGAAPYSLQLDATDEGLVLFSTNNDTLLAVADARGDAWGPIVQMTGWSAGVQPSASIRGGRLHLVHGHPYVGFFYRSAPAERYGDVASYSGPARVVEPGLEVRAAAITAREIVIVQGTYPSELAAQRCGLDSDCADRDEWLPEPPHVSEYSGTVYLGERGAGLLQLLVPGTTTAFGTGGGTAWSAPATFPMTLASERTYVFEQSAVIGTGRYEGLEFYSSPGLTPMHVALDVGSDGTSELAVPGMLGAAVQTGDLADTLNAYLASHSDASDGTTDGFVTVPLSVASAGAGQVQLEDLELAYLPSSAVAGFAQPRAFSPSASPGVLDTSNLSVLVAGPIAVTDASGALLRTISSTLSAGRYVATFDGRDGVGNVLPSGLYPFGPATGAIAEVEIDDLPPTVELHSAVDGTYGGLAPVHGKATDADYSGSPKNFARFVLEYSRSGTAWTRIAASTRPVDGVLGTWDTRRLAAGSVTVRLTAYDRAGNSSTTSRVFGISSGSPLAPVIDTPTIAGRPYDSATPETAVAGTAEPGTVVTVFVNGVAVGTSACDGRWSIANVALPAGLASITAAATRGSLTGPLSQPVLVARFSVSVAVDVPASAPAGTVVAGTVTVTRTSTSSDPVLVRLMTRDATGAPIGLGLTPTEQVVAIPGSGTASFPIQLGDAALRTGTYALVATAVSGASPAAEGTATITFEAAPAVVAALTSDQAVYSAHQVVGLEAQLTNSTAGVTGELQATIAVVSPSGGVTTLGPFAIDPIAPRTLKTYGALFGNPPLEQGIYLADLVVTDAWANVAATASTDFEVRQGGAAALTGHLLVNPTSYLPGDPLVADWSVTDTGAGGPVDVSVLLLRAEDGLVFARHDDHVDVPPGGTVGAPATLSTAGADGTDFVAVLLGNGRGLAAQSIVGELVPDTTPPVITIQGFADGEHRSGAVTPVILIADESPFTSQTTLDGAAFTSGTDVIADGEYVVSVHAVDAGGYEASATRGFTIDTIAPVIDVIGVFDGELTSTIVRAAVSVTDLHPKPHSVSLDGAAWYGLPVTSDGDHVLAVTAEDLAGNRADASVAFSIDTLPPVISIAGVADGGLYAEAVAPVVTASDAHPQAPAWAATLNGLAWEGGVVSEEGDWLLAIEAVDLASNAAQPVHVQFAIDLTPPVIRVTGVTDGLLTREAVTPVVAIDEPHPGTATLTLDGVPFVSGTVVTAEGDHVLHVAATDAVGHSAPPVSIAFTRDSIPPSIGISGVADGATYFLDATPSFTVADAHPGAAVATLDGLPFVSGTRVTADGLHVLQVSSTDLAGNSAAKTVTFRVTGVQATVVGSVDSSARVLVAVNCEGQPATCESAQAGVFLASLAGGGIPYDVALDPTTFLQKVRLNRHNVRVLYRNASSATNSYWELRELTYEGGGLVVVNEGAADSDPKLKETIGVGMLGSIKTVGTVTIAAGDLGPARTLSVAGGGIAQSLTSASATAVGTSSKGTVVTTHRYGSGRTVTLTLNPEANDTAPMRDLVVQIVRFAAGGAIPPGVAGAPQYVRLTSTLTSPAGPFEAQLDAWTAANLVLLSDAGVPTTPPRSWTFPLAAGSPVVQSLAVSSAQKGTYAVLGELGLVTAGSLPRLVAQGSVDVTINGSIQELKDAAIAAVAALPSSTARSNALVHLNAVDPAPPTKPICEAAITETLEAIEDLKTITGTAAADARLRTDQLLRALQVLHATLP